MRKDVTIYVGIDFSKEKFKGEIMMKNLTPEMIEKAKVAKNAEELLEIAKAGGVEMTADEERPILHS